MDSFEPNARKVAAGLVNRLVARPRKPTFEPVEREEVDRPNHGGPWSEGDPRVLFPKPRPTVGIKKMSY